MRAHNLNKAIKDINISFLSQVQNCEYGKESIEVYVKTIRPFKLIWWSGTRW